MHIRTIGRGCHCDIPGDPAIRVTRRPSRHALVAALGRVMWLPPAPPTYNGARATVRRVPPWGRPALLSRGRGWLEWCRGGAGARQQERGRSVSAGPCCLCSRAVAARVVAQRPFGGYRASVATDPMERLLRLSDLMWSTVDRSARAWRMGEWALLCQIRADGSSKPRDPSRFAPDRGSSLALDDCGFLPQLGTNVVSSTARFPVMSAAESLVGASHAYSAAIQQRRTSNLSTGTLCRSAIENAAKTIWLLGGDSRKVRRARCLGYTEREIGYQRQYIEIEEKFFAIRNDDRKAADYRTLRRRNLSTRLAYTY